MLDRRITYLVVFIAFILASVPSSSQGATRYWYFGTRAMMEFTPQGVQAGAWLDSSEVAPGVLYGAGGKGLYYMTSTRCFDAFGRTIEQGTKRVFWKVEQPYNLPQSIMFFPPGRADSAYSIQAHVFGKFAKSGIYDFRSGGVSIHKICPSGNGGNSSISWLDQPIVTLYVNGESTRKQAPAAQTVVPHANGRDLWLIIPMLFPKETWVIPVTTDGIDTLTMVKNPYRFPRAFIQSPVLDAPNDYIGEIKASPDISKLAYVAGSRGRVVLYDFDANSGLLTNEREFSDTTYWKDSASARDRGSDDIYKRFVISPHGIEFSPDGTKIYVTNIQMAGIGVIYPFDASIPDSARGELVQYDITLPTAEAIRASRQVIVPMSYTNRFGGMQLAPDGKIYIAQRYMPFVSCIEQPNERGAACNFVRNAVNLVPGTRCGEGFPFVMANTLSKNLRVVPQDVCEGDTMYIDLAGGFITDSVRWDFGDASSTTNIGYGRTGKHYYSRPGTYLATATMYIGSDPQKPVMAWVNVHPRPTAIASALPDTVCEGDSVILTAKGGVIATWFRGLSTDVQNQVFRGNTFATTAMRPGVYTAVVETIYGCLDTTSITLNILTSPTVVLSSDTTVCLSSTVTLEARSTGEVSSVWTSSPPDPSLTSTGNTATFTATASRQYTFTATAANGCVTKATMNVRVTQPPRVVALRDTVICRSVPVSLMASGANTYTWADSVGNTIGTGASIVVEPRETSRFVVTGIDSNGCIGRDTVTVTLSPDVDVSIAGEMISCNGEQVILIARVPPGIDTNSIMWLDSTGGLIKRGNTLTVAPNANTRYLATVPGSGPCIDTAVHDVKVGVRPVFNLRPQDTTVCVGETVVVRSSTGEIFNVPAQQGTSPISLTASDSVGCSTTVTSYVRGISPGSLSAGMKDTTVDIGNGATRLTIDLLSSNIVGATLQGVQLRVEHKTRSIKVNAFHDARTSTTITPDNVSAQGSYTAYTITVPTAILTADTQPLVILDALPLIDDDSVSSVTATIESIDGLSSCADTTPSSGTLTITGCGRSYLAGLRVGSPLSVRVYPNPAADALNVYIDMGLVGTATIDLVDAIGQKILSYTLTRATSQRSTTTTTIDLNAVPSGIYRVVVTTPTQVESAGVVKR